MQPRCVGRHLQPPPPGPYVLDQRRTTNGSLATSRVELAAVNQCSGMTTEQPRAAGRLSISCIKRGLSMRKSQAFSVLIAVALAMTPQFAEAGPCSHDIAGQKTGGACSAETRPADRTCSQLTLSRTISQGATSQTACSCNWPQPWYAPNDLTWKASASPASARSMQPDAFTFWWPSSEADLSQF